jgi:hypothetical protein
MVYGNLECRGRGVQKSIWLHLVCRNGPKDGMANSHFVIWLCIISGNSYSLKRVRNIYSPRNGIAFSQTFFFFFFLGNP